MTRTIIWFIGFSSATDYSLTSSNWTYNLDSITLTTTTDVSIWDYVCNAVSDWMNAPACWLILSDWSNSCTIKYLVNSSSLSNGCTSLTAWTYTLSKRSWWSNYAFDSINISVLDWDTEWWLIIQNGTSELSPIITSIFSVMWEFIPYVVYIWIWILLCTLWFTAIKRLMNRLSWKITKYFK